jgi:hypothetical protein
VELPLKTPFVSGHIFCGMELEHTKCFLRLFRIFQFHKFHSFEIFHKCFRFNTEYNFQNNFLGS